MTGLEADFWTKVFLLAVQGEPPESAAGIADECLALLRKRTTIVLQTTAQEEAAATEAIGKASLAAMQQRYQWIRVTADGDVYESEGAELIIKRHQSGNYYAYATPECDIHITCPSLADACKEVNWPAWDAAVKGDES